MRWLGISLVLIGGLMLAIEVFEVVDQSTPVGRAANRNPDIPSSRVLGGIAVTAGLIFLTVGDKRDTDPADKPPADFSAA